MTDTPTLPLLAGAWDPVRLTAAISVVAYASGILARGGEMHDGMAEAEIICPSKAARRRGEADALNISINEINPFPTQVGSTLFVNKTGALVNRGATLMTITTHRRLDGFADYRRGLDGAASRIAAAQILELASAALRSAADADTAAEALEAWNRAATVSLALSAHALEAHPGAFMAMTLPPGPTSRAHVMLKQTSEAQPVVIAGPDEIDGYFAGMPHVERLSVAKTLQVSGYSEEGDIGPIGISMEPMRAPVSVRTVPMDMVRIMREAGISAPRLHPPVAHGDWNP